MSPAVYAVRYTRDGRLRAIELPAKLQPEVSYGVAVVNWVAWMGSSIVGILLGNWLYVDVFSGKCATSGVDWLRHIVQIITAAVLVMIAATATGRRRA